jgi:biotin operon repressor
MKEGSGIRSVRNGLWRKVCRIFVEDPKATISRQEIAQRFGVSIKTVDNAIEKLRAEGIIESARIYKLAPGAHPELIPQPIGKVPRVRRARKAEQPPAQATNRPEYWSFGKTPDLQEVWR